MYIRTHTRIHLGDLQRFVYSHTSPEIRLYEPKIAFFGGKEGFDFYYKISKILPKILNINSRAFIEIGATQAKKVIDIFKINDLDIIKIAKDMQKLDRLLILKKS